GLVEIFLGAPPAIGTTKISLFVLIAPTNAGPASDSMLLVYATSWPSGEIAYISCPPSENGGTSWSPGVRSRGVFAFFCSGSRVGCDSEEGAGDTPASTVVVSAIASEGIKNRWLRLNSVNAFR